MSESTASASPGAVVSFVVRESALEVHTLHSCAEASVIAQLRPPFRAQQQLQQDCDGWYAYATSGREVRRKSAYDQYVPRNFWGSGCVGRRFFGGEQGCAFLACASLSLGKDDSVLNAKST